MTTEKSGLPAEVILEQSASGKWEKSGDSKSRFKPWQRLWLVTGIIYLLLLAGSYYMLMPSQEKIERDMVLEVMEEVRRYEGLVFAGEAPKKIIETARSKGYSTWIKQLRAKYHIGKEGDAGFDRIEKNYRDTLSNLPAKRMYGLFLCLAAWAVPMSLMYAAGLAIDWINRGKGGVQT